MRARVLVLVVLTLTPLAQAVLALPDAASGVVDPALAAGAEWTGNVTVLTRPGDAGAVAAAWTPRVLRVEPALDRVTLRADADALHALAGDARVGWVEAAPTGFTGDMVHVRAFTGTARAAGAPWRVTGAGVTLALMDDGLDRAHADLAPALAGVIGGNAPTTAHGTHSFGVALGRGTLDADATGIAPSARGVFASWQSGLSRWQVAENASREWDARVLATPFGADGIPLDNAYGAASVEADRIARDLGVLVVQSMGNCGPHCARREAMAKNVLSVGALHHFDNAWRADDSWDARAGGARASTGPAADGRVKPDVVGPFDAVFTTAPGDAYTPAYGGTSAATAAVAGVVVLVQDALTRGLIGRSVPEPSPALLKALVIASARDYAPHQALTPIVEHAVADPVGRDVQGWGAPDLARVLDAAPAAVLVDDARGIGAGERASWTVTVPAVARALDVTLAWSDAPGDPTAARALVNDLDLVVRDPSGAIAYRGNAGLLTGAWSAPAGEADRVNNVERVRVPAPVEGAWTVSIRGADVSAGVAQPFALVAFTDLA